MNNPEKIVIDGATYVLEGTNAPAEKVDNMSYVLIRTYSAGVHTGYLKDESKDGKRVVLINSRRIWKWVGANTLSEIATHGVSEPDDCRFGCPLNKITLTGVIENIECTQSALNSITKVKIWEN